VIGGHAQTGVISGTGSGAVKPVGGYAGMLKIGGAGVGRTMFLFAPSPLAELKKALPDATIEFDPGLTPAEAALAARRADLVIAFGIRIEGEGVDGADLSLPWGQDAVIDAVASANPNTIVVLETGNPALMPWRGKVRAIVQAWYPGQAGAQAIAEILTGQVNPSGRLPMTFPESLDQTPRPQLPGLGTAWGTPTTIRYDEGAEVGYRWYAQQGIKPMYPFGHGLGYTLRLRRPRGVRRRHGERHPHGDEHRRTCRRRRAPALSHGRTRWRPDAAPRLRAGRAAAGREPGGHADGRRAPAGPVRHRRGPVADRGGRIRHHPRQVGGRSGP
jgi:hypothetical protein